MNSIQVSWDQLFFRKNAQVVVSTDILTPNGLTIDHRAEKLYFSRWQPRKNWKMWIWWIPETCKLTENFLIIDLKNDASEIYFILVKVCMLRDFKMANYSNQPNWIIYSMKMKLLMIFENFKCIHYHRDSPTSKISSGEIITDFLIVINWTVIIRVICINFIVIYNFKLWNEIG